MEEFEEYIKQKKNLLDYFDYDGEELEIDYLPDAQWYKNDTEIKWYSSEEAYKEEDYGEFYSEEVVSGDNEFNVNGRTLIKMYDYNYNPYLCIFENENRLINDPED